MSILPFTESLRASTGALALALAFSAAILDGCTPQRDNNGNIPLVEVVEAIKPGKHTRDEVATMLGSPSARATFEQEQAWYYIGKRTETLAFFTPEVLEHRVLEIRFDDQGIVKEVKRHDATTADKVDLVERTTPTKGNELTFVEQLIGNLGRFNQAGGGGDGGSLGGP